MATHEQTTTGGSPLDARIDSVEREIAYGNLWVAMPGLKTLFAEVHMTEDEEALSPRLPQR